MVHYDGVDQVDDSGSLALQWSDGHSGSVPAEWLKERAFSESSRSPRESLHRVPVKFWAAKDMQDNIPTETFDKVINAIWIFYCRPSYLI